MNVIRIRHGQMDALQAGLSDAVFLRMASYVRETYPDAVSRFDQRRLVEEVAVAARRAAGYGLEMQSSVLAFVSLRFTVGVEFDRHPSIRAVLTDSEVPGDARMERLAAVITEDEWVEARTPGARR